MENVVKSRSTSYRKVKRARFILLVAEGMTNKAITYNVELQRSMVAQWSQRFDNERLAGLEERPWPGNYRLYSDGNRLRVIGLACNQKPADETQECANFGQGNEDRARYDIPNSEQGES